MDFSDLIPKEDAEKVDLSFDDLIPSAASAEEPDPFAEEDFGDTAARRGQQFVAGATSAIADVPRGLAISAARGAQTRVDEAAKQSDFRAAEADALAERLKDPDLKENERAFIQRQMDDLRAGSVELDRRSQAEVPLARESELYKLGDKITEASENTFGKPDPRDQTFWAKLAYGAGTVGGMVAGTVGTSMVAGPTAGLAVGTIQGMNMNQSAIYKEALDAGADEETALQAAQLAMAVGATEIIPITRALKLLPSSARSQVTNKFLRMVIDTGKAAGEEAVQETLVNFANNMIAQGLYDPERGWNDGLAEGALIGAILGGGLGLAGSAVSGGPEEPTAPPVVTGDVPPDASAALNPDPAVTPPGDAGPQVDPDAAAALNPETAAEPQTSAADIARQVLERRRAEAAKAEAPTEAPTEAPAEAPTPEQVASGDTAPAEPESPETLAFQREALIRGEKRAVLYPYGSVVPPEVSDKKIRRTVIPGVGVLDHRIVGKNSITVSDVRSLAKFGKLNEVLELGPYTKADVQQTIDEGAQPAAVVELAPDGTEVKAVSASTVTAPEQIAALETTKTSPENTVTVTTPEQVLAERTEGDSRAAQALADLPPETPMDTAPTVPMGGPAQTPAAPEAPSAAAQALAELEAVIPAPAAPEAQPEAPAAPEAAPAAPEAAPAPMEPAPAPKAETKLERARRIAREKAIESKLKLTSDAGTEAAPVTQRGKLGVQSSEEIEAEARRRYAQESESFRRGILETEDAARQEEIAAAGAKGEKVKQVRTKRTRAERSEATEQRVEQRKAEIEEVAAAKKSGNLEVAEEVRRRMKGQKKGPKEIERRIKIAEKANEIMQENVPDTFTRVDSVAEARSLLARLNSAMEQITEAKIPVPQRATYDTTADAVIWVASVKTMRAKLQRILASKKTSKEFYDEVNVWLADEQALKRGDSTPMRESRIMQGREVMEAKSGADAAGGAVASSDGVAESTSATSISAQDVLDADGVEREAPPEPEESFDGSNDEKAATVRKTGVNTVSFANRVAIREPELKRMGYTFNQVMKMDRAEANTLLQEADALAVKTTSGKNLTDEEKAAIAARTGIALGPSKTNKSTASAAQATPKGTQAKAVAAARTKKLSASEWLAQNDPDAKPRKVTRDTPDYMLVTEPATAENARMAPARLRVHAVKVRFKLRSMMRATNLPLYKLPDGAFEAFYAELLPKGEKFAPEAELATQVSTVADMLQMFPDDKVSRSFWESMFYNSPRMTDMLGLQRKLAGNLSKIVSDLAGEAKIYVLPDEDFHLFAPKSAKGYYMGAGDYIVLPESVVNGSDTGRALHIVLHEAAHAAFKAALKSNPDLRRQMEALMDVVEETVGTDLGDGLDYGFTNVDEFVSELFSNPDFQTLLATIVIRPDVRAELEAVAGPIAQSSVSPIRTVLDAIKNLLDQVLGIRKMLAETDDVDNDTAFDIAMDIVGGLMQTAKKDRARAAAEADATYFTPAQMRDPSFIKGDKPPKDNTPATKRRLVKMGLSNKDADDIAKALRDMGENDPDIALLNDIVDQVKASITQRGNGQGSASAKEAQGKLKAQFDGSISKITKQAKAREAEIMIELGKDFTPERKPKRPRLLRLATNIQMGQIADRFFGKVGNPARVIAEMIEARRVNKARRLKEMSEVALKLREAQKRHTPEQWRAFTTLTQDATMANIHPDRPLEQNKHLSKNGMSDVWNKAQYPSLSNRYNALPQDLKKLYAETRDQLTATQNEMTKGVISNIFKMVGINDPAMVKRFHEGNETTADLARLGPELAAHLEKANGLRLIEGPYFNLGRRGNFVVRGKYTIKAPPGAKLIGENVVEFKNRKEAEKWVGAQDLNTRLASTYIDKNTGSEFGTDKDGTQVRISKKDTDAIQVFRAIVQNEHVEFHETRSEAERAHKQLKADGLIMREVEDRKYERKNNSAELVSSQYRALMETLDARSATSGLTDGQKAEVRKVLGEFSMRMLAGTRVQSHRIPRRNIEGASTDLVRNTFDYVDQASGYLARLDTQPTIDAAMDAFEKKVEELSAKDKGGEGARALLNEFSRRVYDATPWEDDGAFTGIVHRATSVAFLYNLASPGYSFINSMQVGMYTLPILSGDFNPVSATYQLNKAYRDIGGLRVAGSGLADTARAAVGKTVTGDHLVDDIMGRLKGKNADNERAMIQHLADYGFIDADGGLEVARVLKTDASTLSGKFDTAMQYADNLARAMPQSIEAINRSVTALAAYRMSFAKFGEHARAVQYAMDVVNDTQAVMSNSNAAPVFNHPIGRISLQFKKFGQMTYYLLGKNIGRSLRPMEKGERRKGLTSLAYLTASHVAMAGVLGLPFEALKLGLALFSGLGVVDISYEEWQEEVLQFLQEITGDDDTGEMLAFGVTRGLPGGWAFDLNARLGLDSLLTFGEPDGNTSDDFKVYILDTVAGPVGRYAGNVAGAMADMVSGDFSKVASDVIPFKMLADTARAYNGTESGSMTNQEAVLRVFGLSGAHQANANRERGIEFAQRNREAAQRSKLITDYLNAKTSAELTRAISAVRSYNAKDGNRDIGMNWLKETRKAREAERRN